MNDGRCTPLAAGAERAGRLAVPSGGLMRRAPASGRRGREGTGSASETAGETALLVAVWNDDVETARRLIAPQVSAISLMEFDRAEEAIEAGRVAAEAALGQIRMLLERGRPS